MATPNIRPFHSSHMRWQAVTQRDPSAHCSFLYGVTSTKIYCRPTCTARVARRANVVFYDTAEQAQRDGFRPCLKCKPDNQHFLGEQEELVVKALAMLRTENGGMSMHGGLTQLAKDVGVTPSYLCRVFKKTMGMTLGKYIEEFEDRSSGNDVSGSAPPLERADLGIVTDSTWQFAPPTATIASTPGCGTSILPEAGRSFESALYTPHLIGEDLSEHHATLWSGVNESASQSPQDLSPRFAVATRPGLSYSNTTALAPSAPRDLCTTQSDEWCMPFLEPGVPFTPPCEELLGPFADIGHSEEARFGYRGLDDTSVRIQNPKEKGRISLNRTREETSLRNLGDGVKSEAASGH